MNDAADYQATELYFQPVNGPQEIAQVADLAHTVWHAHFEPIIGRAQVVYMLERFQSAPAIKGQLQEGFRYWLLQQGAARVGYIAVRADAAAGSLMISKFYVDAPYRRQGYARQAFAFMRQVARSEKLHTMWLTVNRDNAASIAVYQHLGLHITGALVQDIGHGFVMDDYRMEVRV